MNLNTRKKNKSTLGFKIHRNWEKTNLSSKYGGNKVNPQATEDENIDVRNKKRALYKKLQATIYFV